MNLISKFAMVLATASVYTIFTFSQTPATVLPSNPPLLIALPECIQAAISTSPLIKLADFNLATANATLLQATAKNGLIMGESIDYSHQGTFLDTTPASSNSAVANAAAGSTLNGENVQGILSLTGPSTSLNLRPPSIPVAKEPPPARSAP
jgi:hypothetical protein